MKFEDVIVFCEREQADVTFYTDAGNTFYSWNGGAGSARAVWGGPAVGPDPNYQEALNKAQKFKVTTSDGSEKILSREEFEKLLPPTS